MVTRVAVASDHAGFELKSLIVEWLGELEGVEAVDLGPADTTRTDYPDWAATLAGALANGAAERGVLVCGTGIGISIAANKHPGVRAALVHDVTTARLCRAHNDANVLCLGQRIVGQAVAREALEAFLGTAFEGGRHADRVAKIHAPERAEG
ncbi:MAG: ribose 5-phosphate isomerase B [Myxococcales bacterium]|nr:ribose 5-phosphate isomerase B [Myxococcales bacterium]